MFTFQNPIIVVLILIIFTVLTLSTIFLAVGNNSLKKEVEELNDELSDKERKISQMDESIKDLRKIKHDNIKQIDFAKKLLEDNKYEEAVDFLEELLFKGDVSYETRISSSSKDKSLIKNIASCIDEKCRENNIDYKYFVDNLNSRIAITPSELNSVITNILDNAVRAVMENGDGRKYIRLNAYEDNILFCVEIRNNGPKIQDTSKIFSKGFTGSADGNGFGLFIVKEIVDKYRGCVYVESNDINTVFTVLLPKE